ncbi:hypothetical protein SO802_022305 [Lithocarpus litseifolius]|uniref:RING-type domain-containing protein n=1 Tax=Lithocarpus litseifolius TaxID=425828 RepID=A0AAW2CK78_9ROSI
MYCLFMVWKKERGRVEWSTGEVDQDFSHISLDMEESVQAQNFGHLSLNIEELVQAYRRSSHLEPPSSDIKQLDPADQKLERALARLPAISIFDMDKLETPSGNDCVICLEDFEPGGQCQKFPICNHIFHFHCIRQWLLELGTSSVMRMNSDLGCANESGLPQVASWATSEGGSVCLWRISCNWKWRTCRFGRECSYGGRTVELDGKSMFLQERKFREKN